MLGFVTVRSPGDSDPGCPPPLLPDAAPARSLRATVTPITPAALPGAPVASLGACAVTGRLREAAAR